MRFPAISSLALVAGIAVAMACSPGAAQAAACPLWVAQYCVVTKDSVVKTVATNPCLAQRAGERILHKGACAINPFCRGGPAPLCDPVCSLDPFTHAQRTFCNLCSSDASLATLLHNGACRPGKARASKR